MKRCKDLNCNKPLRFGTKSGYCTFCTHKLRQEIYVFKKKIETIEKRLKLNEK